VFFRTSTNSYYGKLGYGKLGTAALTCSGVACPNQLRLSKTLVFESQSDAPKFLIFATARRGSLT